MSDVINFAAAIKNVLDNEIDETKHGIPEDRIKTTLKAYFSRRDEIINATGLSTSAFGVLTYPGTYTSGNSLFFDMDRVAGIRNEIDLLLSFWSQKNSVNTKLSSKPKRVFISHGRSEQWRRVQEYLEQTLEIPTLELAQAPNMGRTIFQKLIDESEKCGYAVIIMTGDDLTTDDQVRARENVLHEIGYFQGKYGADRVCLLHENSVNIPSNIHGLAYIPFPKDSVESALGNLTRELKHL